MSVERFMENCNSFPQLISLASSFSHVDLSAMMKDETLRSEKNKWKVCDASQLSALRKFREKLINQLSVEICQKIS